jgi:hypothetical protein
MVNYTAGVVRGICTVFFFFRIQCAKLLFTIVRLAVDYFSYVMITLGVPR